MTQLCLAILSLCLPLSFGVISFAYRSPLTSTLAPVIADAVAADKRRVPNACTAQQERVQAQLGRLPCTHSPPLTFSSSPCSVSFGHATNSIVTSGRCEFSFSFCFSFSRIGVAGLTANTAIKQKQKQNTSKTNNNSFNTNITF